jgi:hypothetical protein
MSRCNTIIAAALAAAALAAPTALAQPPDIHAGLIEPASEGQSKQDLRIPSAGVDHTAQASDDDKHATTDDNVTAAEDRALAQERYYESHGKPTPPTIAARTVPADTTDGIARPALLSAVFGALILGFGAGSGLHLLHVRRRYRTRPAT